MAKREVVVQFTRFSDSGTKSVSIGVEFDRTGKDIDAQFMEENFCGSRLVVDLEYKDGGDNESGQQTLQDEVWETGPVACECKQFTTKPECYTATLNFLIDDIDLATLRTFKGNAGTISYNRVGDMDADDVPGQQKLGIAN